MTVEVISEVVVIHPRDWRDEGACVVADQRLFFPQLLPGYKKKTGFIDEPKAKAYCEQCHVVNLCLAWALVNEDEGIWGGLTPEERDSVTKA